MMVEAKMEKELCRGRQLRCSLGQMSRCLRGCWLHFSKTLDLKGRLGCSKEGWMRMTSLVRQLRQSLDFVGALVLLEQDYSLFKIYPMMLAEDKVLYTVMGQLCWRQLVARLAKIAVALEA